MIVSSRTVTSVWKWPKCSSVRGEVKSVDTHKEQHLSFLPFSPFPGVHHGFCPCPLLHPTATQVLLAFPHHTLLSSGPISLGLISLRTEYVPASSARDLLSVLFVLGVGFIGVSKTDVVWSTVK